MLLNSLFCFRGKDSGLRTLAILSASYFFALIWMALFGLNASIVIPTLLGAPVISLTGFRRVRDAQKPQWWSYVIIVAWLIWALMVYFTESWSVGLITGVMMLLLSSFIALPASQGQGRYVLGYQGPVTANVAMSRPARRVEPSLDGASEPVFMDDASVEEQQEEPEYHHQPNRITWLDKLPLSRQQIIMAAIGIMVLVLSVIFLSFVFSSESNDDANVEQQVSPAEPLVERTSVEFKDGFNLSLEGDKLFMSWNGDTGQPQTLWSLATAKGDKDCQNLTFNNGSKYRPIQVKLLPDTSTEAQFSPLDTASIIKDVALRGKAQLCGYSFSLKGTQAVLSKNKQFRAYIE
ncbi:hypothetical protein D5018_13900 [Parashewanella curva]|uniref:DUF805 domain-containing protein n=1 Tax=Parashewanella curva TaxID=2338552 RepID=A0A3L8PWC7_9GAMM|nr:hypothetical protein [Parashewanella curva]RLV59099.1 hypothetical protein D5018_13900 [Parashewanella curva]